MIDLQLVLDEVRNWIQDAPLYLILVWLGGALMLLAQVVSSADAVVWSPLLTSSSSTLPYSRLLQFLALA